MKKLFLLFSITTFLMTGCEWLEENVSDELSEEEVIEGLKTALEVGTDSSATELSIEDGYYGNSIIKIPLPDEAVTLQENINTITSAVPSLASYLDLDEQFENVVKSINRAAEESAKEVAPIFKTAITDLSISEGWDILNGIVPDGTKSTEYDSTAATQYLSLQTFDAITSLYAPKIDVALDDDLGLGFSANDAWSTLTNTYNNAVSTITGNLVLNAALELSGYSLDPIELESIGEFATEKALDGLFYRVGVEEKKIRKDPWQWVSTTVGSILTKVFGSDEV